MTRRILIATTEFAPFHGGIGTYVGQIAAATTALGHDVTVLAPDYGADRTSDDRAHHGFAVVRYHGGTYERRALPRLLWQLARAVGRRRWDIVHAADWPTVLGLGLIRRLRPLRFRATVYGTELLGVLGSHHVRLLAGGQLFAPCERLLAISEFTRDLLQRRCPDVPRERVVVTPLGVDDRFFAPPAADAVAPTLARLGIPTGRRLLLTVARLDPRKGHRLVLAALDRLAPALQQELAYVVVGRGEADFTAELRRQAAGCAVPVVFTGGIDDADLLALYAAADLFVMPGEPRPDRVEGFGLAYLEAAAQSTPAVASRVGAVPEVVRHGETGLLVEPGDVAGLAAAVTELIERPERLRELAAAAREQARRYTWQRCARLSYDL